MAKGGGGGLLLPVSADGTKGNGGGGGAAGDAALFKGSAMTRLGAAAAISYMGCSGTSRARSALSQWVWLVPRRRRLRRTEGVELSFVPCRGIWVTRWRRSTVSRLVICCFG